MELNGEIWWSGILFQYHWEGNKNEIPKNIAFFMEEFCEYPMIYFRKINEMGEVEDFRSGSNCSCTIRPYSRETQIGFYKKNNFIAFPKKTSISLDFSN